MSERIDIVAEVAEGYGADWPKEIPLVDVAAAAGASAIKFQLMFADELVTADHPLFDLVAGLELSVDRWRAVADRCQQRGIELFCDVFGAAGLRTAEEVGVAAVKVHSSDMLNPALLDAVAASAVPRVILSAGGTELDEVRAAVARVEGKRVTVVHGFQTYPTPPEVSGLARLTALRNALDVEIGFADHTGHDHPAATWLPTLALALGATYIEKHLTLAQVLKDPDHESALAPDEFARFVDAVDVAAAALGDPLAGEVEMNESELAYRLKMKKHVVAARRLERGARLSEDDVVLKRSPSPPPDALFALEHAIGATLAVDVGPGEPIARSQIG